MARTTAAAVKDVLRLGSQGGDYDDANNPSLDPYIDSASLMIDRVAACGVKRGTPYTTAELEMLERYVAAHRYCMSDVTYSNKSTDRQSTTFTGQTAMGLDATRYGQDAMLLDAIGCLINLHKGRKASGGWIGKTVSEQIDYEDRN